jgi:hypothetical protein
MGVLIPPVIQERKAMGRFDQEVIHSTAPQDILLNLTQLRSTRYTQTFQPVAQYPDLPCGALISQAVVNHREMKGPIPSNELAIRTLSTTRAGRKKRARPAAEPSASKGLIGCHAFIKRPCQNRSVCKSGCGHERSRVWDCSEADTFFLRYCHTIPLSLLRSLLAHLSPTLF